MTTLEILENYIYPNLDIEALLSELSPEKKTTYYRIICPMCGKKEAYIPKKFNIIKPYIVCNRLNKCAYKSSIWNYLKHYRNLSNKEVLSLLAEYSNLNLSEFQIDNFQKSNSTKRKKVITIKYKKTLLTLPKRYKKLSLKNNIENFHSLTEKEQFQTIITYIYLFSLKTDHSQKYNYYKNRKIDYIPNDIGFINRYDFKRLHYNLTKLFPIEKLEKFKVLKYDYSSFSVIPSFDIWTNLITAIRFRNIYSTAKLKEIEISHKRILNPLPYGVTREKLKKFDSFYFTEGHIDALSLGVENFVAIEGIHSFNRYNLGLFLNKEIYILFDKDKAGIQGAKKLKTYLDKLNIKNKILSWDIKLGKDINEVKQHFYSKREWDRFVNSLLSENR